MSTTKSVFESTPPSTCFTCTRLNPTTFKIEEDDKESEHPFIYARIFNEPSVIVLSDTGVGGLARDPTVQLKELRTFIETYPVAGNNHRPLNARISNGKTKHDYIIICSHCHYDHIGGIEQFRDASSAIVASSYSKEFITRDLATTSLCRFVGIPTPVYTVSRWVADFEYVAYCGKSLGLQIIHTPGHTPDELAFYDEEERWLYVGDTFYERVDGDVETPIIFPKEGDLIQFMPTLNKLFAFVKAQNADTSKPRVKLGCGHITASADGEDIIDAVRQLFWDIIAGKVPVKKTSERRGEMVDLWQEDGEPRFSVRGPRRLVQEARKHFDV
ncbi:MAG: hypothetical protein M1827_003835 [Pycnora praestabilis]|nr:MAG: hypothetical protein M1827_003835 [Pycnora praestabilis]